MLYLCKSWTVLVGERELVEMFITEVVKMCRDGKNYLDRNAQNNLVCGIATLVANVVMMAGDL